MSNAKASMTNSLLDFPPGLGLLPSPTVAERPHLSSCVVGSPRRPSAFRSSEEKRSPSSTKSTLVLRDSVAWMAKVCEGHI